MFFIDYRDPLFGIIILFSLIFIISFANFWWGVFKSKEEKNTIKKFIKRFEQNVGYAEYKKVLENQDLPTESVILTALMYEKGGEYEKAINIYLSILKNTKTLEKKKDILTLLGKTYFKAGFLKKSKDVFLSSLKLYPRNEEALTYISVVYEKLRDYEKAIEVLNSLEELGLDIEDKRTYFQCLSILKNKNTSNDKKIEELKKQGIENKIVQRMLFELIIKTDANLTPELAKELNFKNLIDLVWQIDQENIDISIVKNNDFLSEIFSAKDILKQSKSSDIFELDVLIKLHQKNADIADLNFEYLCTKCKHIFPLYFYRCPNCQSIGMAEIETILVKRRDEKSTLVY